MAKTDEAVAEIAEKLDELSETIDQRFETITNSIDALVRGLSSMATTQSTHSDMLAEILTACSADPGASSDLTEVLDKIAAVMEQQTEALSSIDSHLAHLGGTIETSVARGMARVMDQQDAIRTGRVDEDGVILEDD